MFHWIWSVLEYITTLLSRLFEGVWLRGVMLGWDPDVLSLAALTTVASPAL